MKPESVDLIVTSPPYAANKDYESWKGFDEYEQFAKDWIEQATKILKPNGTLMLNVGYTKIGRNQTLPLTYLYHAIAKDNGLQLVQEIVWRYYGGMGYKLRYSHRSERILWLTKDSNNCTFNLDDVRVKKWVKFPDGNPTPEQLKKERYNPNGCNPTDIWDIKHIRFNNKKERIGQDKVLHPAQFPEEMIERIIKAHSNEGDLVFDPFVGSGTTVVVANRLNRNSIGIDIEPDYIEIANIRIK